jgi:hypothetical protein
MTAAFLRCVALGFALLAHGCCSWDDLWPDVFDFVFDNTPICNPNEVRTCTCNTGAPGQQKCHDDGRDYSPCACIADAGVVADGGVSDDGSAP